MNWSTFARDNRAVAPVIGFILILGFLVLLLAVYQAQVIPQQNAETELEHHQETRDELRSLHNAISTVGADQEPRFQSINLGTAYESRTLGINPPPPAGTIRTEQHNISITNESGSGTKKNISTQFIEYQPGYNELNIGSTWYENSVLYFDERDRGNSVGIIEDQELVDSGNVTIVALQNEFQETGTGRVTLELYPSNNLDSESLPDQNETYTVEIPTRLNESDWEAQLEDELEDIQQDFETGDPNVLNLSVEPDALEVNPVGIRLEPDEQVTITDARDAAEDLTVDDNAGNLLGKGATGEGQGPGRFEFGIRNSGENDLELVALGIINTSTDAVEVSRSSDQQPRLAQDDNDLIMDNIMFDDNTNGAERYDFIEGNIVTLGAGETVEDFEFFRFKNDDGDNVNLSDENINITVWVEDQDGEESQTTLELKDTDEDNGENGDNQGFLSTEASDMNTGNEETQTFTVELSDGVEEGSEVEINLDDAQDNRGGQNQDIIYPTSGDSLSTDGSGQLTFESGNQDYSLIYTADQDDIGEEITVTVEDIDTSEAEDDPYDAEFILINEDGAGLNSSVDSFNIN